MNLTAKGTRNERRCEEALIKQGYLTRRATRTKYHKVDFFGFDVIAIAKDGAHLLFVQVKSNVSRKDVRDKIRAFKMPECCQKWLWVWYDRDGWKKERL